MAHRSARGFTYLAVLILLAIAALAASLAVELGAAAERRAKEDALLATGGELRAALASYASATAAGASPAPESIAALLRDPRYPATRRHLRKAYIDPLTGKAEWGIVRTPDGKGIAGFYSLAAGVPVKQKGFALADAAFEDAQTYRGWLFAYRQY